ncbi:MAG: (Fe-S)-binding protein [Bacteroidia bacterium]
MDSVKTIQDYISQGKTPEIIFWVGCAGSYDERAQRVSRAFANILQNAKVEFAILGMEEGCTGDPAKRAGNEFLFQMQAMQNIELMNGYGVKKIVTACPHCFNTLKNDYPELGGNYEVIHHTQFINELLSTGRLSIEGGAFTGKKIVYHDSCYLGRANNIYEAPRMVMERLDIDLTELKRCRTNGLCCGAGGAQMFKEAENGNKEINIERAEEAVNESPEIIAVNCPFCLTMLKDGVKHFEKEDQIEVLDLAELVNQSINK